MISASCAVRSYGASSDRLRLPLRAALSPPQLYPQGRQVVPRRPQQPHGDEDGPHAERQGTGRSSGPASGLYGSDCRANAACSFAHPQTPRSRAASPVKPVRADAKAEDKKEEKEEEKEPKTPRTGAAHTPTMKRLVDVDGKAIYKRRSRLATRCP